MIDLWPQQLGTELTVKAPVTILREQAALLGQKTHNLIEGRVESGLGGNYDFHYDFLITSTVAGLFRFKLFSVHHNVIFYPVLVVPDRDILYEIRGSVDDDPKKDSKTALQVDTEEDFLNLLRQIFAARKTQQVIAGIMAQVAAETPSGGG